MMNSIFHSTAFMKNLPGSLASVSLALRREAKRTELINQRRQKNFPIFSIGVNAPVVSSKVVDAMAARRKEKRDAALRIRRGIPVDDVPRFAARDQKLNAIRGIVDVPHFVIGQNSPPVVSSKVVDAMAARRKEKRDAALRIRRGIPVDDVPQLMASNNDDSNKNEIGSTTNAMKTTTTKATTTKKATEMSTSFLKVGVAASTLAKNFSVAPSYCSVPIYFSFLT